MIKGAVAQRKGFCGPEAFTEAKKKIAAANGVVIQNHFSGTRRGSYDANTCQHCNAFVGEHFLFTDYYVPGVVYGNYKFEVVDLA